MLIVICQPLPWGQEEVSLGGGTETCQEPRPFESQVMLPPVSWEVRQLRAVCQLPRLGLASEDSIYSFNYKFMKYILKMLSTSSLSDPLNLSFVL